MAYGTKKSGARRGGSKGGGKRKGYGSKGQVFDKSNARKNGVKRGY